MRSIRKKDNDDATEIDIVKRVLRREKIDIEEYKSQCIGKLSKCLEGLNIKDKKDREDKIKLMYESEDVLHSYLMDSAEYRWLHKYTLYSALKDKKVLQIDIGVETNFDSPANKKDCIIDILRNDIKMLDNTVLCARLGEVYSLIIYKVGNIVICDVVVVPEVPNSLNKDEDTEYEDFIEIRLDLRNGNNVCTGYNKETQMGKKLRSKFNYSQDLRTVQMIEIAFLLILKKFTEKYNGEDLAGRLIV